MQNAARIDIGRLCLCFYELGRDQKVAITLYKTYLRSDRNQCKQLFDHVIIQSGASIRGQVSDFARVVGPVDHICGPREVHRMGAKRIVWTGGMYFNVVSRSTIDANGVQSGPTRLCTTSV